MAREFTLLQLRRLAREFGKTVVARGPARGRARVTLLSGELGAGKTQFVQFLALSLGVTAKVLSPTFVFIHEYALKKSAFRKLIHADCYRIGSKREFEAVGLEDYLRDPANLVLIEWGDKIQSWIPKPDFLIRFRHHSPKTREVSISGKSKLENQNEK